MFSSIFQFYLEILATFFSFLAKAVGSRSARVPYLKGNFIIEGLPEGIEWRKQNGGIKSLAHMVKFKSKRSWSARKMLDL